MQLIQREVDRLDASNSQDHCSGLTTSRTKQLRRRIGEAGVRNLYQATAKRTHGNLFSPCIAHSRRPGFALRPVLLTGEPFQDVIDNGKEAFDGGSGSPSFVGTSVTVVPAVWA
jgi:hypothetical protein